MGEEGLGCRDTRARGNTGGPPNQNHNSDHGRVDCAMSAAGVPYMETEDTVTTAARDACAALLPGYVTTGLPTLVTGTATKTENRAVLADLKERGVVGPPARQHVHVYAVPVLGSKPQGSVVAVLGFHPGSAQWFVARVGAPVAVSTSLRAVVDYTAVGRGHGRKSAAAPKE